MRYELEYVFGLLNAVFFSILGILPIAKARKGISTQIAVIAIVAIIIAGGVIIYLLVVVIPPSSTVYSP